VIAGGTTVILRVVNGRVRPGEFDDVVESFRRNYRPIADATPGLVRYVLGTRPTEGGSHDLAVLAIWETIESALAAYGGDLSAPRTLDRRDHGARLERVDYYELEAVRTMPRGGTPTLLRLTAGTVARGLDADIQQELRRRLPDLPDEAQEAFVGRRVIGSSVEIAFVSTWTGEPAGLSLAEPIWPGISDRYESFRMAVHEIVLGGAGPAAAAGGSTG